MGNKCSLSGINPLESSINPPLSTSPELQFSGVENKHKEHPIESPMAPNNRCIHCDHYQACYNFQCQLCSKCFHNLQALIGHQNAHRNENASQKRPSQEIREQMGQNDNAKGKKKPRCCTIGSHHHGSSSDNDPDYRGNNNNPKIKTNPFQNEINFNQDGQNSSNNQNIIYSPKPLRVAFPPNEHVTRPTNQGNYQPSYSFGLNPNNNQSIPNNDEPSFGRSRLTRPPPPPPPPPPPSPTHWPSNWGLTTYNIHGIPIQLSGPPPQEVRFPRPNMFRAQKPHPPQPKPVFPPGLRGRRRYGPTTSSHDTMNNNIRINNNNNNNLNNVNNNNVGEEQPNACNLDLTLRL